MLSSTYKTATLIMTSLILSGTLLATALAGRSPAADVVAGQKVYEQNRCMACHVVAGKGGKVGPDLSKEGAKRSASWLSAEIQNPKSHTRASKMPAFADKIKGKDLSNLVAYLRSLK